MVPVRFLWLQQTDEYLKKFHKILIFISEEQNTDYKVANEYDDQEKHRYIIRIHQKHFSQDKSTSFA